MATKSRYSPDYKSDVAAAPASDISSANLNDDLMNKLQKEMQDVVEKMQEMKLEIEGLKEENVMLKMGKDFGESKPIKGYDPKSSEKPEPYDCDPQGFIKWSMLFKASMCGMDGRWKGILNSIEEFGRKKMKKEDFEEIERKLQIDEEVRASLFLNLLQYTKGNAHAITTDGGEAGAYESYRYIFAKGKNNTVVTTMLKKKKVNNPEPAKTVADVEKKLGEWKADIRALKELGDKAALSNDQLVTTLIGMLPNSIVDYLITKHDILKDEYDDVEETLYDYLARIDIKEESKKKLPIGAVGTPGVEEAEPDSEDWEYGVPYYDPDWNQWLCTTTERHPKRARSEEELHDGKGPGPHGDQLSAGGKGDTKGKGKGKKGKGKGTGPKGGCHECGGDHYVRECPIRKGKTKGKGKHWSAVPKNTWNSWYPGPSPATWKGWWPGTGGKGQKAEKGKSGMAAPFIPGPGCNLVFPPLGAVQSQEQQQQTWEQAWPAQEWPVQSNIHAGWLGLGRVTKQSETSHKNDPAEECCEKKSVPFETKVSKLEENIGFIEVVSKKKKKVFKKSEIFDDMLHKAISFSKESEKHKVLSKNMFGGLDDEEIPVTSKPKVENAPTHTEKDEKDSEKHKGFSKQSFGDFDEAENHKTHKPKAKQFSILRENGERKFANVRNRLGGLDDEWENAGIQVPCAGFSMLECKICAQDMWPSEAPRWNEQLKAGNARVGMLTKEATAVAADTLGDAPNLSACTSNNAGWTCISLAVDSGACDNVIDMDDLPGYADFVRETMASKNGINFVSASGDPIPNFGEVKVPMFTREGTCRGMTFQAAGVAKPLGSVKRMIMTGHIVVFDSDGSYIMNKATKELNALREEDGNFMLDLWIPPPEVARSMGFVGLP